LQVYDKIANPIRTTIFAKVADKTIDPYLVGSLELDREIKVFVVDGYKAHLPLGEQPGAGEPRVSTPAPGSHVRPNRLPGTCGFKRTKTGGTKKVPPVLFSPHGPERRTILGPGHRAYCQQERFAGGNPHPRAIPFLVIVVQ